MPTLHDCLLFQRKHRGTHTKGDVCVWVLRDRETFSHGISPVSIPTSLANATLVLLHFSPCVLFPAQKFVKELCGFLIISTKF